MIEAYLAYCLVLLFFIILAILLYFVVKSSPPTASNIPAQPQTTPSKPDIQQ